MFRNNLNSFQINLNFKISEKSQICNIFHKVLDYIATTTRVPFLNIPVFLSSEDGFIQKEKKKVSIFYLRLFHTISFIPNKVFGMKPTEGTNLR